jgi:hypothetical protein
MHDLAIGDSLSSEAIEHIRVVEFQATVTRTVRLARAALLHVLEAIDCSRHARPGPIQLVLQPLL